MCAGAGAMIALAVRPALRHGAQRRRPSCSPASAWPAATWAPARCCRASSARAARPSCCYTGRAMAAEEGAAWGFFNRLSHADALLAEAQALARALADGPDVRARHDQDACCTRNGRWTSTQAIEAEAQAQAICMQTAGLPPRVRGVRRQAERRASRATDWHCIAADADPWHGRDLDDSAYLRLAVLRAAHARLAARARRLAAAHAVGAATPSRRRRRLPRAGARARRRPAGCATACRRRTAARCRSSTRARCAWCARRSRATTASPISRSRCRAWAAAPITLAGSAAQQRAACRASRAATRSPRSRCPSPTPAPTSPRCAAQRAASTATACGARRRQDLDLQRRHRRLLLRVRAHRRGAGRARHLAPSSSTPTRRASRSPSAST